MKRIISILIMAGSIFPVFSQKATLTEGTTKMSTYGFADPNPVANPSASFYPYWRFDQFDSKSQEKEWKSVILENDYIQVTLFPEVGGKIWGAIDKTTGKEFVYYNHVVKFRDIAMRGAWTSGGIEFNFGLIGHVPTTATPVDYCTREKEDGSVSCYVSSYELLTRTQWTVEVNVPKDKAYFTTQVTWANTTPLEQPYYQWMNAAFKADGDLQLCYPGNAYIGHGGDAHTFPMDDEGHDLSFFSQNAFGADKSYHVLGEYANYYGAYWHDDDYGFAHCSRHDEKLGRKFFCWSQARQGEIWKDLLTDDNPQYVELQAGRMFNQPGANSMDTPFKHPSFLPMGTDTWTEYWYPVEKIGAYCEATPVGAISLGKTEDGKRILSFSPTEAGMKSLKIYAGDNLIHSAQMQVEPLKVCTEQFDAPQGQYLKVVIGDDELVYEENPEARKTDRPLEIPKDIDNGSAYGHFQRGEQFLNIRHLESAEKELKACLEKDAYFLPALSKMASLKLYLGYPEEATNYLRTALSINTYDGEANYLWGVAQFQLGHLTDAKDGFSLACYNATWRSASYAMLAKVSLCEHNLRMADTYIGKSLEANPNNVDARELKLLCMRLKGDKSGRQMAEEILDRTPLNHIVRYELMKLQAMDKDTFLSAIRCEMPEQELLEMAWWYLQSGCVQEALELCEMTEFPMAGYLRAYLLRDTNPTASRESLKKASSSSVQSVFPFRMEMLPVLEWAATQSDTWQTRYYYALLCWKRFDKQKALDLLEKCGDSDFAPLFIARSNLKEGEARLADLRISEQMDPSWRVGNAIVSYYMEKENWTEAVETASRYFKQYPDKFEIGLNYASSLCSLGEYEKCIQVLGKFRVMPKEGAYSGHAIYRKANLMLARKYLKAKKYSAAIRAVENSKIWNENLGVGKPYENTIDYTTENKLTDAAKAHDWQMADSIEVR